jgi:hypothetical protein
MISVKAQQQLGMYESLAMMIDGSSLLRWYVLDLRSEFGMCNRIHRPVLNLGPSRMIAEKIVAFPVGRRPDRSLEKAATADRANILQNVIDTICAERTFVGADSRVHSMRRQWLVAIFTGRSQFEHSVFLLLNYLGQVMG